MYVCMLNCLSHVWLFATPWTASHQTPLFMRFPRQEYWSGLSFPPPGHLLTHGSNPCLLRFLNCRWILYRWATREARILYIHSCLLLLSSLFDITLCCCCCSVTKSCLNLCDLMACSTPGSSVLHYLLAFAQIHMHWVGDVNHLILCLFLLVLPSVFPRITLNFIYTHHLASTKCSFSA